MIIGIVAILLLFWKRVYYGATRFYRMHVITHTLAGARLVSKFVGSL